MSPDDCRDDDREPTFRAGAWPTVVAVAVLELYAALTWAAPHRSALVAIGLTGGAGALAIFAAPVGPLLRSRRWCTPFCVAFSGSLAILAAIAAGLDGGTRSPLVTLLFLPLAFAAMSYPPPAVLGVSATVLASFTALAATTGGTTAEQAMVVAGSLAVTAWMCAWQARDQERRRRELGRASRTDHLTGCLNRRGFEERARCALDTARRNGTSLALVVLDLDGFKAVNDAGGHAAGDEQLRWVASTLRATMRTGDEIARLGGDEFAVVLPSGADRADLATARITEALALRAPASVGAAVYPRDGVTLDALQQAADVALYASKAATARDVRRAA